MHHRETVALLTPRAAATSDSVLPEARTCCLSDPFVMRRLLHNLQLTSSGSMRRCANDIAIMRAYATGMSQVVRLYKSKQPSRPHYVGLWAERRGFEKQTDLAAAIGADKSLVSRWYAGTTPSREYQEKLAILFKTDRESLFRHPDEEWLAHVLRNRTPEEIVKIRQLIELAFPISAPNKS